MKIFLVKSSKFYFFLILATLWSAIFFISPEFLDNPSEGINGFLIVSLHWLLVSVATFFVVYALAVNRYIFAISFPLFSLLGSILAFYRYAYKATLTPMLVDAALHNDIGTTLDLISPEMIIYVLISLGISIFFVRFRFRKIEISKGWIHLCIAVGILSMFFVLNERIKASILQRFPFSVYYNLSEYSKLHHDVSNVRINPDPTLKYESTDSITVVLVLGESLRADHLRLNGYGRQTNPFLSKRNRLISLPHIYSEYTNTNRSLPHILTRADSANIDIAFTESSFVSLFKQCGFSAAWISNQDPAETYVSFINECDTVIYAHPEKSVYNYNNWLDEDLLDYTHKLLRKKNKRDLLILHTIGSHWYYNNHFSKKCELFKPVTQSRIIAQCSPEQIINSYDNTAVYTDYFLDRLFIQLQSKNAIVIFLSDHGEVLGEDGAWLHAGDNIASKNPACLVWFSDIYAMKYPEKLAALEGNQQKRYRTDFLFHSILDAGNIPSSVIRKDLNIFTK